jgi:hypothetical protein
MIHYHELDPLYWAIADIVDSVLGEELTHLRPFHMHLKSDLVSILRADLPATVRLFHTFGYPGLEPHERAPFVEDLLSLVERHADVVDHFNYMMLKGVIQAGRTLGSLVYIEGNPRHLLIERFSDFYRGRVTLFKNAHHVFDEEKSIQDSFLAVKLTSGGVPFVNYRFADSKSEPGIQISDVVIGLLGKMHTYFVATSADEVSAARDDLSGASLENALLLRDLISISHEANIAFQQHIASGYDRDKADRFLRFIDGAYAP